MGGAASSALSCTMVVWAATLAVRHRRRGGVDGVVSLVSRICNVMVARLMPVEWVHLRHGLSTATGKVIFVPLRARNRSLVSGVA
jgi:hypothetical protein